MRKTDSRIPVRRQPVHSGDPEVATREEVEVTHSRLDPSESLSLDDADFGGDPYNSTGRFSAIDPKKVAGRG